MLKKSAGLVKRYIPYLYPLMKNLCCRGFFCEEDHTTYVGRGKTVPLLVTDMGKEAALRYFFYMSYLPKSGWIWATRTMLD